VASNYAGSILKIKVLPKCISRCDTAFQKSEKRIERNLSRTFIFVNQAEKLESGQIQFRNLSEGWL
jgi:hypothetical protein